MIEIRIHGLGGQGAVTLAEIIAVSAFDNSFFSQAFPSFGPERMGSPVEAYVRIDEKEIRLREHIYNPDFLIFIEEKLLFDKKNTEGLNKKNVVIIVASEKDSKELRKIFSFKNIICFKGSMLSDKRFINMALAGIFAKKSGFFDIKNIEKAISSHFEDDQKIKIENIKAAKKGFEVL
jgi:pyruvate ferredoxin oxidoreductase gamma subunit